MRVGEKLCCVYGYFLYLSLGMVVLLERTKGRSALTWLVSVVDGGLGTSLSGLSETYGKESWSLEASRIGEVVLWRLWQFLILRPG